MQNVLDVPDAINNTEFEYRTAGGGYIDMLCTDSRFLVEQKNKNVYLDKPEEHLTVFRNIFSENRSRNYIEKQLSEKAGSLVANLHNELEKQYENPNSEEEHHSLALLTVRIVFCLYAEDAGISSASIARISKGENVNTETLLRICQYLKCDIKDICEVKQVKNN